MQQDEFKEIEIDLDQQEPSGPSGMMPSQPIAH